MPRRNRTRFTIGTLAQQADVAVDTIRYYEREGLLPQPQRSASGYREYAEADVRRVRFIRRAKDLGFSLEEIRELLSLESDREHGVEAIKERANRRLDELDRRIAQLVEMRDELARLVAACPGAGAPESCPILTSIHGEEAAPDAADGAAQACCSTGDRPGKESR